MSTEVLTSYSSAYLVYVLKGYDRCMLGPQEGGILSEWGVPITTSIVVSSLMWIVNSSATKWKYTRSTASPRVV
eukprot:7065960-Prorocentrum_lima.AAC.1